MGLGIRGAAVIGSAVVEAATGTMPTSPAGLVQSVARTGVGTFRFTLSQQVSILETDVRPVTIGAAGAVASWSPVNPTADGDFTQFDVSTHLSGAPTDVDFSVDLIRTRVADASQSWTPTPVGSGSGVVQAGQEFWQRTGDLITGRAWHCFIPLPRTAERPQGGAMVLGGSSSPTKNGAGALNTTEIFDPVTGTWSAGPNLPEARIQGKCIPFRGGKAVLLGGMSNQTFTFASTLATSYVVDLLPAVPTFTPVGGGGTIPAANNFRPGALACMDVGIPAIAVVRRRARRRSDGHRRHGLRGPGHHVLSPRRYAVRDSVRRAHADVGGVRADVEGARFRGDRPARGR
jgi:hypothetical protein